MRHTNLRCALALVLLIASPFLFAFARTADNKKQIEVKLTEIGQQNCRGEESSEASVVRLKLRLKIKNVTNAKLIVSRAIGAGWYGYTIAKDEGALAAGTYESNPNIDWGISESDTKSPPADAPPEEFTILRPGKSFTVGTTVYIGMEPRLRSGDHVFRLDMGTWFHVADAEPYQKHWAKYGELVYLPTNSDSLSFRIPPETEFIACKS